MTMKNRLRRRSAISMPSKRAKESDTPPDVADPNIKGPIETLPTELLVDLIKYLPNRNRARFGLACKRFHSLDMAIPRRFKNVYISQSCGKIGASDYYDDITFIDKKHEDSIRRVRQAKAQMFPKNAFAEQLDVDFVWFASTCTGDELLLESITILDTMKFKTFKFYVRNDFMEYAPRVFDVKLERVRDSEYKMDLQWENAQNLPVTRSYYASSEMKEIKMKVSKSFAANNPGHFLLDAVSLEHIVRHVDNARLESVNCHPDDVLRIFEICCDFPDKCISLWIGDFEAKALIERIRERGASEDADAAYLLDRGTILEISKNSKCRINVVIWKESQNQHHL